MKFKFDFEVKKSRSTDGLFTVSLNGYSATLKRAGTFKNLFEWQHDEFEEETHGWAVGRNGLYETANIKLPFALALRLYKDGMSYAEAVGFDKDITVDWIIDEFDSSFDALAVASMKYHMDWSVAVCPPERRAVYEKLIEKFETRVDYFTEEELNHFDECRGVGFQKWFGSRDNCVTCKEANNLYKIRIEVAEKLQKEARVEFVEKVLPTLWS